MTELRDSELSDNDTRDSEEDAGQKRSSQKWSCKFVITVVIIVNIQINRSQQLCTVAETLTRDILVSEVAVIYQW
jgi:hypothetical protein